uniref:2-phosphoglycerate kinase n=2 Tax=Hemiselmis andersenii TaxID=464988 RepID=A0A7S1H0V6_HEMAN|mmetsp:Transcript_28879/g.70774  ORF Transcript_28879/g.70774 Transcript_28879/m.70774 type:complete len:369 (+) Transcript_28879:163-1269(+)
MEGGHGAPGAEKDGEERQGSMQHESESGPAIPPRHPEVGRASSKYDFVKVRVWLADHYYTFSRFLVSRVLSVTKVSYADTLKISLALKKELVDKGRLDVTQEDMEASLFAIMRHQGYGDEYISRYRLLSLFNHQRVPLVILICGTGRTGKSTLATQLAERLNLSAVLQTDLVFEVMRQVSPTMSNTPKALHRRFGSREEFLAAHAEERALVRGGLEGELRKVLEEGKTLIIEGSHLDPEGFADVQEVAERRRREGNPFIFVPFTLSAAPADHQVFLNNSSTSERGHELLDFGDDPEAQALGLRANLAHLDAYLREASTRCSVPVLRVGVQIFGETLDALHTRVLEHIHMAVRQQGGGDGGGRDGDTGE